MKTLGIPGRSTWREDAADGIASCNVKTVVIVHAAAPKVVVEVHQAVPQLVPEVYLSVPEEDPEKVERI